MQINYIEKTPTAMEFNTLTESVGWGTRKNNIIEEALKNTLSTRKNLVVYYFLFMLKSSIPFGILNFSSLPFFFLWIL